MTTRELGDSFDLWYQRRSQRTQACIVASVLMAMIVAAGAGIIGVVWVFIWILQWSGYAAGAVVFGLMFALIYYTALRDIRKGML